MQARMEEPRAQMLDVMTEESGRVSVMVELPEDSPPSNYIPMEPRMLVIKLSRRQNDGRTPELLQVLSTRAGLRCSLRWDFPSAVTAANWWSITHLVVPRFTYCTDVLHTY